MVAMSAAGRVGRNIKGLVVTGGSKITGSCSGWEKLLVRVLGTSGAGGLEPGGGTIASGSRK
jgi:hypothetical protein